MDRWGCIPTCKLEVFLARRPAFLSLLGLPIIALSSLSSQITVFFNNVAQVQEMDGLYEGIYIRTTYTYYSLSYT